MPENQLLAKHSKTVRTRILKVAQGNPQVLDDHLSVEEPLEVAVRNESSTIPLGVVFRTPGDDESLVLGMLKNEGLIETRADVVSIRISREDGATMPACRAIVTVRDLADSQFEKHERVFPISSACGACGKSALEALRIKREKRFNDRAGIRLAESALYALPLELLERQTNFRDTGGIHAAARFDSNGQILGLAEDIGRHNAMDKLVGDWLQEGSLSWCDQGLLFSGRLGYDLIQKAISVGCPFLVSIGAPSSFAVELANLFNITLVGFLKSQTFNVYSAPQRIQFTDEDK